MALYIYTDYATFIINALIYIDGISARVLLKMIHRSVGAATDIVFKSKEQGRPRGKRDYLLVMSLVNNTKRRLLPHVLIRHHYIRDMRILI